MWARLASSWWQPTGRDTDPLPSAALNDTLGALAGHGAGERLRLTGLDRADVARLIGAATGTFVAAPCGIVVDDSLAESVRARTEGNPFFISEIVRLIASERAPRDAAMRTVPAGVRDVTRRRLARLPAQANTVLAMAAVVGREFGLPVVAMATDLGIERTLDAVEAALMSGIVVEDPALVGRYRFSHALVRDAVADQLSAMRRAGLHARVGAAIENMHAEPGDVEILALAHHYGEAVPAGTIDQAFEYVGAAADIDLRRLAYESARRHLERALQLLQRMPAGETRDGRELAVQTKLTFLLTMTRGYSDPQAEEALARASELSLSIGHDDQTLAVSVRLGAFHYMGADLPATLLIANQMLEFGSQRNDPSWLVAGAWFTGSVALQRGQLALAEGQFARGLAEIERLPLRANGWTDIYLNDPTVQTLAHLAIAVSLRGETALADRMIRDAIDRAHRGGNPFDEMSALYLSSWIDSSEGDVESAYRRATDAIGLGSRHGLPFYGARAQIVQGWAISKRPGNADVGLGIIRQALDTYPGKIGRTCLLALVWLTPRSKQATSRRLFIPSMGRWLKLP